MEAQHPVTDPITFSPKPRSHRRYGISIKYFEGDEATPNKRLNYQIGLRVDQYRDIPNTWQLCFSKEDLFIDQHAPDLVAEQLADRAMKVLYPIKVDVNAQNEPFRGIVNHEEIVARWEAEKVNIRNKYEGDYLEMFIHQMEKKLANKGEIEASLKYDMFWSAFFHPQYFPYGENKTKAVDFDFPILPYSTFRFSGRQTLKDAYSDYGTYQVGLEAQEDLPKALQKFGEHAKMKLSAEFDLDRDGGLMKHAVVNWGIYSHDGQVSHKRIRFSAYEIEHGQTQTDSTGLINDESSTAPRKKGFWERILG